MIFNVFTIFVFLNFEFKENMSKRDKIEMTDYLDQSEGEKLIGEVDLAQSDWLDFKPMDQSEKLFTR